MPIYEYVCVSCSYKFDKLQAMAASGADCERCGQPSKRAISLFSSMAEGEDGELVRQGGGRHGGLPRLRRWLLRLFGLELGGGRGGPQKGTLALALASAPEQQEAPRNPRQR